jgi:hypothetical protein
MGWFDVTAAIGFAGAASVLLAASRHTEGLVLGILGLINCGLFMFAGVSRALWARQIRRKRCPGLGAQPGQQVGRPAGAVDHQSRLGQGCNSGCNSLSCDRAHSGLRKRLNCRASTCEPRRTGSVQAS